MKFILLFLALTGFGQDVSSDCPSPFMLWSDIADCGKLAIRNDPHILKHLGGQFDMNCTGKRLMVKCLRELEESCAEGDENEVTRYEWGKILDIATLDRATDYFCENIDILTDNRECLNNMTETATFGKCMQDIPEIEKYFADPTFFKANTTAEVDAMMPALCSYSYGYMKCYEAVKKMCDAEAVAMFLNLVYANTMTACRVAK